MAKTKIYIASDHRGVALKLILAETLARDGNEVVDLGTDDANAMVDYPEIAARVANAIAADDGAGRGILICGTGAGIMIAANRYKHIRASRLTNADEAKNDRFHDDINVACFAADDIDPEMAIVASKMFLQAPFDNCERRIKRIMMMS